MITRKRGFTLIELMIVVAIVAILAGIAYPSYREFVRRSDRADARTALLENAQFLERNFTVSNSYNKDSAGNDLDSTALPVKQSPRNGAAKYNITIDAATATAFTLKATPTGSMAGDACGTFKLAHTGQKTLAGNTKSVADCWNR
jgi:type IV pilus assembly protein PilE